MERIVPDNLFQYPTEKSVRSIANACIARLDALGDESLVTAIASQEGDGIEAQDIDVLKLLYLVRYIDDVKANLDNITILMADDIRTDKIVLRKAISESLTRLTSQNYIGRNGDTYNFLTDEEQDIQRAILHETQIGTTTIVERIAHMIYGDIYTSRKFRYKNYDFAFDQMVDGVAVGTFTGGKLRFLTVATSLQDKSHLKLMTQLGKDLFPNSSMSLTEGYMPDYSTVEDLLIAKEGENIPFNEAAKCCCV